MLASLPSPLPNGLSPGPTTTQDAVPKLQNASGAKEDRENEKQRPHTQSRQLGPLLFHDVNVFVVAACPGTHSKHLI